MFNDLSEVLISIDMCGHLVSERLDYIFRVHQTILLREILTEKHPYQIFHN